MQTDNTTAVQTAIDLACLFANPLLNSGQEKLARLAIDVSLTVFSRMVLTDEIDGEIKIEALKSYLSNSNSLQKHQQDFYNFLAADNCNNLKTLLDEKNIQWSQINNNIRWIASKWSQSTRQWGVAFEDSDLLTIKPAEQKQAFYTLLKNPPANFYEMFFYGKAVKAVETSNKIVETAQRMNQELLADIAAQKFLSVAEVQAKIQERRNVVSGSGPARSLPPGAE